MNHDKDSRPKILKLTEGDRVFVTLDRDTKVRGEVKRVSLPFGLYCDVKTENVLLQEVDTKFVELDKSDFYEPTRGETSFG